MKHCGKTKYCSVSILLFCACLFSIGVKAQEGITPEQAKATLIFKILGHISWPNETEKSSFDIGLYKDAQVLLPALSALAQKYPETRSKKHVIKSIDQLVDASELEIVIISASDNDQLSAIAKTLRHTETLLISENADDKRNVMINFFYPAANRLSFELNRSSVVYEGLTLSKQILLFGGTELDVATLYKETEAELAEAVTETSLLQKSLALQKLQLAKQINTIKAQNQRINAREHELSLLEKNVIDSKQALRQSEDELQNKVSVLAEKEANIQRYSARIQRNRQQLALQETKLGDQKSLISQKNSILSEQGITIQSQQQLLLIAVATLALILLLTIALFRNWRSKQRINLMLQSQTQDLETANQKLLQMSEAKSQFLSTMSHELRTPLNGVLGMVELLKDTRLDQQQDHYLDTIHSSGDILLNVINDILDYSKIEAGKMPIENVGFDLEELIYSCAAIFCLRTNNEIEFIVDTPSDCPHQIKGDPTRIRQIILNLLNNAFKFTASGEISLNVVVNETSLSIAICDTGVGLSQQQCDGIFDAFAQADTATTRKYGGTGLGLAICTRLANLMSGDIALTSTLGKGSQFSLNLPLILGETGDTTSNQALKGFNVLIAEPNATQLSSVAKHFQAWGMVIQAVDSIETLQAQLNSNLPDVILMAENIGGRHGLDLAQQAISDNAGVKVIVQSTTGTNGGTQSVADSKVVTIVTIPVRPSLLYAALVEILLGTTTTINGETTRRRDTPTQTFAKLKVLVAEDNLVNQMVIKGLLKRIGIAAELVENGVMAVRSYDDHYTNTSSHSAYDLILMDCEMPELDGLSATRQIRALEQAEGRPHTAVVALTAHAMDEYKQKAFAAGMDYHLAKPLKPEALSQMLGQIFG